MLLLDAAGRVLLFRGFDPADPERRRYWFTAGGGVDPGETPRQAASRELYEETGLLVPPDDLGEPVFDEVCEFPFGGHWYRQEQEFFVVRVPSWEVATTQMNEVEQASIDGHRWWTAAELEATTEKYYPDGLPQLLREVC